MLYISGLGGGGLALGIIFENQYEFFSTFLLYAIAVYLGYQKCFLNYQTIKVIS